MLNQINKVKEFHEKFNIHIGKRIGEIDNPTVALRIALIKEEAKEVENALNYESNENVAKELCDLLYVTYGTILAFGLQDSIEECFEEVHRSNMSKLDENGNPQYREDGKLLKGDNYSPADLKSILQCS